MAMRRPDPGTLPGVRFELGEPARMYCPDDGEPLREAFDDGAMACGCCGRRWPLVECIEALAWVLTRATTELTELQLTIIQEAKRGE